MAPPGQPVGHRRSPRGGLGSVAILALVAAVVGGSLYYLGHRAEPARVRTTLSLAEALGDGATAGFARAFVPRPFAFPADHGPHPAYRTEWWYYTGNLDTAEGRHFGFQVTFFRAALAPHPVARASAWGASQVYVAHFAVTDVAGRRFYASGRVSRGALGLAGAEAAPFRVWLEDWSVTGRDPAAAPMRLRAAEDSVAVDLTLESTKQPVFHGNQGLSRKGSEAGNASYYYSLSRLATRGTVRIGTDSWEVRGRSWMDREWGTSALGQDEVGWDWLALQLSDGREVMLYQLRRRDGGVASLSSGTLILHDGSTRPLTPDGWQLELLDRWSSPRDGTPYPSRWRLRIPSEQLELEVVPYLADQELDLTVRYWEGAVRARGVDQGAAVTGSGYVELTGYAAGPVERW